MLAELLNEKGSGIAMIAETEKQEVVAAGEQLADQAAKQGSWYLAGS